ncbi:uncharacterized protein [Drosophila tropicalis]|uniref:uncharacterized protein n=1 Tax=Drosophila tropicalis TaxID=46794 RepID=UPI0035AC21D0
MAGNFRNKIINKKSLLKPKETTTTMMMMASASSSSSSTTSLHTTRQEGHFSDLIKVTQLLSSADTTMTTTTDDKDYYYNYDDCSDLNSLNDLDDEFINIPDQASYMVHIKNLPNDATVQEIRKIFANYNIRSLNSAGSSAYIEIESREEVIKLLKLDEPMCRGRRLFINIIDRFAGGDSSKTANENKNNQHHHHNQIEPTNQIETIDTYQTADTPTPTTNPIDTSTSTCNSQLPAFVDSNDMCNKSWIENHKSETPQSSLEKLSIDDKPSSIEELEKRMQLRLQKLCEFENAETLRMEKLSMMMKKANDSAENTAQEDDEQEIEKEQEQQQPQEPITPMSWRDFCKQQGL